MSYVNSITAAATRYGVPPSLAIAVAQRESGIRQFNADGSVVSRYEPHLGEYSLGIFQLLQSTARDLGVNPNDPEQNIQGGVRYLKMAYDWTGGNNWRSALEAYNGGIGNWQRGTTTTAAKSYATAVLASAGIPATSAPSSPSIYVGNYPTPQQPGETPVQVLPGAPVIGYQPDQASQNSQNILASWFGPQGQLDTWSVDSLTNDPKALLALGGLGLVLLIAALS